MIVSHVVAEGSRSSERPSLASSAWVDHGQNSSATVATLGKTIVDQDRSVVGMTVMTLTGGMVKVG